MESILSSYSPTVVALGVTSGLCLLQLLVFDATAILSRHQPGMPIEPDPSRFIFRASRAFANTNETLAVFLLLVLFGLFSGAAAGAFNLFSWVYVAGRTAHMVLYWADLRVMRSAAFVVSMIGLVGLFVTGLLAWL